MKNEVQSNRQERRHVYPRRRVGASVVEKNLAHRSVGGRIVPTTVSLSGNDVGTSQSATRRTVEEADLRDPLE